MATLETRSTLLGLTKDVRLPQPLLSDSLILDLHPQWLIVCPFTSLTLNYYNSLPRNLLYRFASGGTTFPLSGQSRRAIFTLIL
jgi:hypothetical protein